MRKNDDEPRDNVFDPTKPALRHMDGSPDDLGAEYLQVVVASMFLPRMKSGEMG